MSAKKETAQFYFDFDELEADSWVKTDDDTNAKDTTIQRLESEADRVNTANKQLQSDDEELQSENGEIKKKKKVFRKIVEGMVKCLPQEKERAYGQSKAHKQELRDENKDWKKRWEITEKELAQIKSAYDGEVLKSQIQQAQIDDLEREREELLNRISKLVGDRLTHDNSNIADLNDIYRPSKLSDTYCELYDNEWTDAFQELTDHGLTEKNAVGMLLDILLVCFHKCREITWGRYQTLKHIVSTIDIVHIPRSAENLLEARIRDAGTNNASNESAIVYSRDKESLCSLQPKEETEIKGNAEQFSLSNGSASEVQNEEQTTVEHMMSLNNPDICNNASNELELAYSLNNEVERLSQSEEVSNPGIGNNASNELEIVYSLDIEQERPSQSEETEIKSIAEIFPLSNGSASNVQNEEQTTIEHMMSVSNPEISNNASKELEIAYSIDKEVDRPSQYEAVSNPDMCTMNASKELEIIYSGKAEVQRLSQCKEEHFTSTIILRIDQEKQIKDIWRTTTTALKNEAVKHLYILLLTSFDIPIKDLEKTSKYLTSCIDLCWKMSVQEKPMYLDAVAEKDIDSEKMFNQDKFKAYTKSGERVDFVVWPALFLNEGGPMIFKGLAQGSQKSDK